MIGHSWLYGRKMTSTPLPKMRLGLPNRKDLQEHIKEYLWLQDGWKYRLPESF